MRILITNIALALRTGSELLVEQTADWLRDAGHTPVIYSPLVGPIGTQMRKRGHLVFDRIGQVQIAPDVIHGHHAGPTMTALAAFPSVPAMFVSHSAEAEFDRPPYHPNILRYFSVSTFLREFWASPEIPFDRIEVLGNPVDTRQLTPRPPLPRKPANALMVAKYGTQVDLIRKACAARGLKLDEVGDGVGCVTDDLPAMFRRADIVFASGRSALEAVATGCAVILTERNGTYGMVRSDAIDHVISFNWGIRLLSHPPTEQLLIEQIDNYDADDATAARDRVRQTRSLDMHGSRLLRIYETLKSEGPANQNKERAVASFMESYVPSLGWERWRVLANCLPRDPFIPPDTTIPQRYLPEPDDRLQAVQNEIESLKKKLEAKAKPSFWRSLVSRKQISSTDPRDRFVNRVSKGKTFIDVGGLYEVVKERVSVAAAAGASQVSLMDVESQDCPLWSQLRARLDDRGVGECNFITRDATSDADIETYDVVHSSGVLYHLPSPFAYLSVLRKMTREWCILSSSTLPTYMEVNGKSLRFPSASVVFVPALENEERRTLIEWYKLRGRDDITIADESMGGHRNLKNYYPNWFIPTVSAFKAMAICAGFEIVDDAPIEADELSHCLLLR